MFMYRGSKKRIAKMYPEPRYRLVIEPFCGSAAYSVLHSDRKIWLNDTSEIIVGIWEWLIKDGTIEAIWPWHHLSANTVISDLPICEPLKHLLGFVYGAIDDVPSKKVTPFSVYYSRTVRSQLKYVCEMLLSIRHWEVSNLDFADLPDVEATWFIDAPYQNSSTDYKSAFDRHGELAEWCQSRRGEVIVCEKFGADWLQFEPLTHHFGRKKRQHEVMWYRKD